MIARFRKPLFWFSAALLFGCASHKPVNRAYVTCTNDHGQCFEKAQAACPTTGRYKVLDDKATASCMDNGSAHPCGWQMLVECK